MSQNIHSTSKHIDNTTIHHINQNDEKFFKMNKDEYYFLFPANRKVFPIPSHNFEISKIHKSRCDNEINLLTIPNIKNVILTNEMEKNSNLFLI